MGSASELEYHLLLARDLKLIQPKKYQELAPRANELKRMLTALLHKLTAECRKLDPQDFKYPWLVL
jgi:four helix bundle protein